MPHPVAVINIVGLNRSILAHAPRLSALARDGAVRTLEPALPAVTCSVQSSMLTGLPPQQHGIVGNGWYDRELAEVHFWKQSNRLVHGEKVWEAAKRRDPSVTCANLFWWFNMYSTADHSVTPRPMYKADGRKLPDVYSEPAELRQSLQAKLGAFPLFKFWGPASSIESSRWIAEAAIDVDQRFSPTLNLVYLPHLDYCLQKAGPGHPSIPAEAASIDAVAARLIDHYQSRGVRIMIVSEYGIEPVNDAIHINRALREAGLLRVRSEEGLELLDPGASSAFAVADHQVAHVYVPDAANLPAVKNLCESLRGVELVLDRRGQQAMSIAHERAGDLVLVAASDLWFSYDYWLDEGRAPDFARTVDIHRKPGYDPLELFLDPAIRFPRVAVGRRLLMRKLGLRTLLDVIPLDASLVRGSHGRVGQPPEVSPVLITQGQPAESPEKLPCAAVRDVILDQLFSSRPRA